MIAVAAGHPTHIVCPCNTPGMPGPCPYLPQIVEITPTIPAPASTFTPSPVAWECPRCRRINAPHVERCDCRPEGGQ